MKVQVRIIEKPKQQDPGKSWNSIPGNSWFVGQLSPGGFVDTVNYKLDDDTAILYRQNGDVYPWHIKRSNVNIQALVVHNYVPVAVAITATLEY